MNAHDSVVESVNDRYTVLTTVNVFQPVTHEEIVTSLSRRLKGGNIENILASLMESGHIMDTRDGYIVSQRGIQALGRSPLRKRRDMQRLLYLASRSKRG